MTLKIKFDSNTDSTLKGLLLRLYPDLTDENVKRLDVGSVTFDYRKNMTKVVGKNDGYASNAEIVNFLIKEHHEPELIESGWIVPFYFRKHPEGMSEKAEAALIEVHRMMHILLPAKHDDCEIEATAEEAIEKGCYACSEYVNIYKGLIRLLNKDMTFTGINMMLPKTGFDRTFDHIGLHMGSNSAQLYVDVSRVYAHVGTDPDNKHLKKFLKLHPGQYFGIFDDAYGLCSFYINRSQELDKFEDKVDSALEYSRKARILCPWLDTSYAASAGNKMKLGKYDEAITYYKKQREINPYSSSINIAIAEMKSSLWHLSAAPSYSVGIEGYNVDGLGMSLGLNYGRDFFLGLEAGIPLFSLSDHDGTVNVLLKGGYRLILGVAGLGKLNHSIVGFHGLAGITIGSDDHAEAMGVGLSYELGWNARYSLLAETNWLAAIDSEVNQSFNISLGMVLHL